MPDNPNTESENPPLDTEDWEIALEPYRGNPGAALTLAFHLIAIKAYLVTEPCDVKTAVGAIDRGVEVLFVHTEFHGMCQRLFLKVITGKITLPEEETLKALGIKF